MHSMNGLIYLIMVQCTASKCFKKFFKAMRNVINKKVLKFREVKQYGKF